MRCDLHVHTFYSYDAISSPKEIVNTAIERHINCLCICDHGEIKGAIETLHFAFDKEILIIPGIEIKSKIGDIVGMNLKKKIPDGLSPEETIQKIRRAGGFVVIPHPYALPAFYKGITKSIMEFLKENPKELTDAIEVLNASMLGKGNKKAMEFAKKYSLPFTAGSDAHSTELIGKAFIKIREEGLSAEQVIGKIRKREVSLGGEEEGFLGKIKEHSQRMLWKIKNF